MSIVIDANILAIWYSTLGETEDYLMALERQRFCALIEEPKTQERIMAMLQTGKPVRN